VIEQPTTFTLARRPATKDAERPQRILSGGLTRKWAQRLARLRLRTGTSPSSCARAAMSRVRPTSAPELVGKCLEQLKQAVSRRHELIGAVALALALLQLQLMRPLDGEEFEG